MKATIWLGVVSLVGVVSVRNILLAQISFCCFSFLFGEFDEILCDGFSLLAALQSHQLAPEPLLP